MELLLKLEDRGYPTEYLLSRIRGRRSRLITDWRPLIYDAAPLDYLVSPRYQGFARERSPEGVWRCLIREYRWVYSQMNEGLRRIFRPFFFYNELRTLFICLRQLGEKSAGTAAELLNVSLLCDEIKKILLTSVDTADAIGRLERIFKKRSDEFGKLGEVFEAEGLRGLEQRLTNTWLAVTIKDKLHPLMQSFFERMIDSRNIMSVYKVLRLEERTPAPLIPGGVIPLARLEEVAKRGELLAINGLIRDFSGIRIDAPTPTKVELALYQGVTRFLKKEGREPFGAGPILDYLWKCSIEVMNLNILFYAKDLERDLATAELVQ